MVAGRPSERWGSEIVAVLASRPGVDRPTDDDLRAHCRTTLAGYKVPKAFCWVDRVLRSPAGKPDYAWARGVAVAEATGAPRDDGPPAEPQSPNSSVV